MAEPKIYCGNGKEKKFADGGSIISVSLDIDLLISEYNNHGFMTGNGKKMIKINVSQRREVGQYGDTHSITLDTWHPDSFNKPNPIQVIASAEKASPDIGDGDDIPF